MTRASTEKYDAHIETIGRPAFRTPAPVHVQFGALIVSIATLFAAAVINVHTRGWLWVDVLPMPAVTIILACATTVYTRSVWPAFGLLVLAFGFGVEAIATNMRAQSSPVADMATRLNVAAVYRLTAELVIGALAGWLWYRREERLALDSDG